MTGAMGYPFDLGFRLEDEWREIFHQQQFQDKLSSSVIKTENAPPASYQFLLSPAFSTTTSPCLPHENSQQYHCEMPLLQCTPVYNHALDPRFRDPPTPPNDHEHDAYQLDNLLLEFPQPAKQTLLLLSSSAKNQQDMDISTMSLSKPSKRRSRHHAPSKTTPSTPSARPSSPKAIKRAAFLERNRISAHKCREKKKRRTIELEKRARELESSKEQYNVTIASLKSELFYLKNELFRHSDCNSAMRQATKDHISASQAASLTGLSNHAVSDPGRVGNESFRIPPIANGLAIQEAEFEAADDDDDNCVDDAEEHSRDFTHFISNDELEALLTRQIPQDKSGERTKWHGHTALRAEI